MPATKRKQGVERFSQSEELDRQVAALKAKREARRKAVPPPKPFQTTAEIIRSKFRALPSLTPKEIADLEEKQRVETAQHLAEVEQRSWDAKCKRCVPAKFLHSFNILRVPASVDRSEIKKVLEWQFGPKGLFIFGETGRSKSWALGELVSRLILKDRRQVMFFDGVSFSNACSTAFSDPSQTERWLKQVVRAEIVVVDDIAKRFTPAAQQGMFTMLDRRSAALKPPVLATSNYSSDDLRAMMLNKDKTATDSGLAEPLIRRLREYSQSVIFA